MFFQEITTRIAAGSVMGSMQSSKAANSPFVDLLAGFKESVYAWCDYIRFTPTFQQRELLDAVEAGETHIAVRSGQGPGKTRISAVLNLWWVLTHGHSRGIVTAPTMRQCKDIWLAEARTVIQEADRPILNKLFKFTGTGYGVLGYDKSNWGSVLVTATKEENMQGQHRAGGMFILGDEASGIARGIVNTLQGTLTNNKEDCLWVMIGNPNTRTCAFFDFFNTLAGDPWVPLHWDAEETPESGWFSKRRNEEVAKEHGKDSVIYQVRVKGNFPDADAACLVRQEDLIACTTRDAYLRAVKLTAEDVKKQIGLDLARYGGDENVIVWQKGNVQLGMEAYPNTDPNQAVDRSVIIQMNEGWKNDECIYVVDTSGLGEMAVGNLGSQRRKGKQVHEYYAQNTAFESKDFHDKASEAWYTFSRAVARHEVYLIKDNKMFIQLTNRYYTITNKGKIKIESKDDYKRRNKDDTDGELGQSPDRADALVMAFYKHATASDRVTFA